MEKKTIAVLIAQHHNKESTNTPALYKDLLAVFFSNAAPGMLLEHKTEC